MESGVELVKRAHVDLLRVAASLCS
ncbi:putative leader peptide [Streptomyces sp. NPDC059627]|uniref:Leader peptide n=1 Tax=Streptomyces hyaluromycini TaxID=1377993 RepID=A0ABV1WUG5_9ACTN